MQLSGDQAAVLEEAGKGGHLLVLGPAGTGKTALRNRIADQTGALVLGPTGASVAGRSGAFTIARFMAMSKKECAVRAGGTLIIDEISMVGAHLFVALSVALQRALSCRRPFGGMRVVLIGDLMQLRPPAGPLMFFQTATYRDLVAAGLLVRQLATQHRQRGVGDSGCALATFVADARRGKLSAASVALLAGRLSEQQPAGAVHLYACTKAVAKHNARALGRHPGRECKVGSVALKQGAPVVITRNRYVRGKLVLANGDAGVVHACSARAVVIRVGPALHTLRPVNGVLDVALAWAMTVHKAQGRTCDAVVVHGEGMFEAGQAYVAVSRARTLEGLAVRSLHPDDFAIAQPPALCKFAEEHGLQ